MSSFHHRCVWPPQPQWRCLCATNTTQHITSACLDDMHQPHHAFISSDIRASIDHTTPLHPTSHHTYIRGSSRCCTVLPMMRIASATTFAPASFSLVSSDMQSMGHHNINHQPHQSHTYLSNRPPCRCRRMRGQPWPVPADHGGPTHCAHGCCCPHTALC